MTTASDLPLHELKELVQKWAKEVRADRYEMKVKSVQVQTKGATLANALTTGFSDGDSIALDDVTDFLDNGGRAVVNGTTFNYTSVDRDAKTLKGCTGAQVAASVGAFVQMGETAEQTKVCTGYLDGDEDVVHAEVRPELWGLFKRGTRDVDQMETVFVEQDDIGDLVVVSGPLGTAPELDFDLEMLPPVGGGDSSGASTDPVTGRVNPPAGMGYEDGDAPSGSLTVEAFGGIGNIIFVRWTTIANSSAITYDIHCSTSSGFTPADNTKVGSVTLAGTAGFKAAYVIKDFPSGHALDGGAADPPQPGTTYYIKVIPKDGSGDGTTSTQVSASPEETIGADEITATHISDGAISTPKLAANAVTAAKIAANTITANEIATGAITADEISAGAVTATKLSVSTLSAITADLGTVTAGSITGLTIAGGSVTSSTGTTYVQLSSVLGSAVEFIVSGSRAGRIAGSSGKLALSDSNLVQCLEITANQVEVGPSAVANLKVSGSFWVGTEADEPPTNYVVLYKSGNSLMAKAPGRAAVQVVAL